MQDSKDPKKEARDAEDAKKIQDLAGELDGIEKTLKEQYAGFKYVFDYCARLVEKARQYLDRENVSDAHDTIFDLQARITQAEASQNVLKHKYCKFLPRSTAIFLYDCLFTLISLAIGWWVTCSPWCSPCKTLQAPGSELPPHWLPAWFLLGFSAGMLGGVLISMYGLIEHSTHGDFDASYVKWYWFKPLVGALSGSVAALPFLSSLLVFNISDDKTSIMVLNIVMVSFLAGFYERFFLKLLDRVGQVILTPGESKNTTDRKGNGNQ